MSQIRDLNTWDKIINIAKNFIYIIFAILGGSFGIIANYVNNFFTKQYTFTGLQITILFIALFVFLNIINYIAYRIKNKRMFKKGNYVKIRHHKNKYFVIGYSFFKPDIVICQSINRNNHRQFKIQQKILEILVD